MHDVLFWIHVGGIIFVLLIGFLFTLPTVLLVVVIHRSHTLVFKECLLSKLQKNLGGLPKNMSFLQFASLRLFAKNISSKQSHLLDYSFVFICVGIAYLHAL